MKASAHAGFLKLDHDGQVERKTTCTAHDFMV